jgi:SAM-dependent methyltransferase
VKALYEYYRGQALLPTFANLQGAPEVERYAGARAAMLRDRAGLLPAVFNGAEVLEFGPDSGENALVFALWGAHVTLVEPNERAHATIRAYFERFGLGDSLRGISNHDVLEYTDVRRYDLVVAEGFIYTVKPTRAWLGAFHRVLHPGGLFLITYYERSGALFELALRALHAQHRRRTGLDATASAQRLYRAKWDSIPHTRTFDSWVMDVLENPFLRAPMFIDARALVDDCSATGFDLYASHPQYGDPLAMDWHKRVLTIDERATRARAHIERSTLSFLAGRKLYIGDEALAAAIARRASRLIDDIDALVEADDDHRSARIVAALEDLAATTGDTSIIADGAADRHAAAAAFRSFAQAFRLAAGTDAGALAAHTQSDPAFIASWGLPVHVAVGRALPS